MAASKTLTPEQRKKRASNAVAVAHTRTRLIKQYAELIAPGITAKSNDEIRDMIAAVAVRR